MGSERKPQIKSFADMVTWGHVYPCPECLGIRKPCATCRGYRVDPAKVELPREASDGE